MKYSNDQVCHVWAQQNKNEGSSGNIFFENDKIFSYSRHYMLARFAVEVQADKRIVLINNNSSSMTTQCKHKPAIRNALIGLNVRLFYVNNPAASRKHEHIDNLELLTYDFELLIKRASKASKNYDFLISQAQVLADNARDYALLFSVVNIYDFIIPATKQNAKVLSIDAQAAKLARDEKRAELKLVAWLDGDIHSVLDHVKTLLRVSKDGSKIQTSRAAHIPTSFAPMVWRAVTHARVNKLAWQGDLSLGDFTLTSISTSGDIVVGCHAIEFKEMANIAGILGYIDAASY